MKTTQVTTAALASRPGATPARLAPHRASLAPFVAVCASLQRKPPQTGTRVTVATEAESIHISSASAAGRPGGGAPSSLADEGRSAQAEARRDCQTDNETKAAFTQFLNERLDHRAWCQLTSPSRARPEAERRARAFANSSAKNWRHVTSDGCRRPP